MSATMLLYDNLIKIWSLSVLQFNRLNKNELSLHNTWDRVLLFYISLDTAYTLGYVKAKSVNKYIDKLIMCMINVG